MSGKPIVVGVDGSAESVSAAVLAWRIAQAASVPLHPVCALPDLAAPGGYGPAWYGASDAEHVIVAATRQVAESLRGRLPETVVEGLEVRLGHPARVLLETAAARKAGLVVVGGSRGKRGGSTVQYLARTLDVPLLIHAGGPAAPERVLVALDLSRAARDTLGEAAGVARLLEAELRAVHVVEPARFPRVVPAALDVVDFERRSVEVFERVVRDSGVERVEREVRHGPAEEAIADEAAAWGATLVVVGSHGKNFFERLLIGSTTERLITLMPASLLVVPSAPARQPAAQRPERDRPAVRRRPQARGRMP